MPDDEYAFYRALGQALRAARNKRSLTQEQIAVALGLTRTSVANVEAGRQRILVHTLVAAAAVLATSLADLLPRLEEPDSDLPPGVGSDAPTSHVNILNQLLATAASEET